MTPTHRSCFLPAALAAALVCTVPARAQNAAPDPQAEFKAAAAAANKAQQAGPADIALADQAVLKLPQGYGYIPQAEGGRLLKAMGNRVGDGLLGIVVPADPAVEGFIVMRHHPSGFVKDDDAKDWKADDMLQSLKEGTEQSNVERRARNIPEIEVTGWIEPPAYDAATHRLVWSLASKRKGAADGAAGGVNYNTYALGREGYISMNLVTDTRHIAAEKPIAHRLLAALEYQPGKRYADFNASTDRVAEFGLAALIGGVAAKKLGLFALIAAFFAKFAKVIGIAALAFGGAAFKFFTGRRKASTPQDGTPPASA